MSDITDKLRLKEKAAEDIYFAKKDRERIKALHEKDSEQQQSEDDDKDAEQPGDDR